MWQRLLAAFLDWLWQREKPVAATITISGITFPLSDFETVANAVIQGVRDGKSPEDVLKSLEPSLLPILETIAGSFIPYGGAIVAILAFAYSKSIPFKSLPQKQQNEIMARFGAGTQS